MHPCMSMFPNINKKKTGCVAHIEYKADILLNAYKHKGCTSQWNDIHVLIHTNTCM